MENSSAPQSGTETKPEANQPAKLSVEERQKVCCSLPGGRETLCVAEISAALFCTDTSWHSVYIVQGHSAVNDDHLGPSAVASRFTLCMSK